MVKFHDVTGQQIVRQTSPSMSGIHAEPVPRTSLNHDPWSDGAVLDDAVGIEQPIVESCLWDHEGAKKTRDQPYLHPIYKCTCLICLSLGTRRDILFEPTGFVRNSLACRYPGCQRLIKPEFLQDLPSKSAEHEQTHFGNLGKYHCLEEGCQTTTKNFADLRRHYNGRHCINAIKYPCPIVGCKYGGDNGFTRKNKLKSHQRNVHQGKGVPGKAFRPIKPKANEDGISRPQGIQTITPKPSAGA